MPVSVIYVNFRVYDDLDRSIAALGPFLDADDEIVVVDNESDPASLAALTVRHPRVRAVARPTNTGFAAAVNCGVANSSRPYLLFLNPDTVVKGPIVRQLEAWLREHPDTGVVGPRVVNADGSVQASARRFPGISAAIGGRSTWLTQRFPNNWVSRHHLPGRAVTSPIDVDWIAGACLMTTRAAFDRAHGLDEGYFLYWEDADYCHRLGAMGLRTTYVPTSSVVHVGGHSAELVPELAIRAFHASALRFHLAHGGWFARLTAPLARLAMRARTSWRLRHASGARELPESGRQEAR